jgi:ABC-type branched-subunit amino acid transport system substrate-binding protein
MLTRRKFSSAAALSPLLHWGQASAQSNKIILGQSAAFTGPAAQLGIQFHLGAKLWFDRVNAQGGVAGKSIEIRKMDDGYEPDRCAENTQKLIDDEVFALFGYIGTPTSLAALPLVKREQIPFIAPFTGAMGLREPFAKNVIHLRASYNDETALIVKQLTHLGLKKIAVFYQNDSYGKAGLDGTVLALSQLGLAPVATATVERNSTEVAKAVSTITAAQPDAVIQVSAYKSCAAFIRAARKAGYGGTFYNVSFVGTQALADELGKDGAGVVVSQVMPSPYNPARPITRDFVADIRRANAQVQANYSTMEGYLAARLFTEGLQRDGARGGLSREGLIRGLESIGTLSMGGFSVHLTAKGHVASSFVELSMLTGDGRVRT